MRKVIYLLIIISVAQTVHGQGQPPRQHLKLHSTTNVGLMNGSYGFSGLMQTILGVGYKGTSLGAGIGLDYYRFRSIPVFAHLSQDFGRGDDKFFVYGDLGHNYDWLTEKNTKAYSGFPWTNFGGGLYYEAGIGLKLPFKNKDAFLLSAGYSYKRIKRVVTKNFCPFVGPCVADVDRYGYQLRRVVVKAGITF